MKSNFRVLYLAGLLYSNFIVLAGQSAPDFLWVRQGNAADNGFGKGLFTDANGFAYVTGSFDGLAAFGTNDLKSYGAGDIFVAKYHPDGALLWVRHAGTVNGEEGLAIAADGAGNCFVTGWYNGAAATFDSINLSNFGGQDIFVAKYSTSGDLQWAVRAGAAGLDNGLGIVTDGVGDCYVTGVCSSNANFNGTVLANGGAFIAKYSAGGSLVWARRSGGDRGSGIGVDASGNCYVAGGYSAAANFDGITIPSAGGGWMFFLPNTIAMVRFNGYVTVGVLATTTCAPGPGSPWMRRVTATFTGYSLALQPSARTF
jgi:hypothetical protein